MKFHLTKEEKYFLLFLSFCLFAYLLVQFAGVENFKFSLKPKHQEEIVFPLDLNAASISELIQVPGIGMVYAGRIVQYRYENGGFKNIDELVNVKGIGEKKLQKLRNLPRNLLRRTLRRTNQRQRILPKRQWLLRNQNLLKRLPKRSPKKNREITLLKSPPRKLSRQSPS